TVVSLLLLLLLVAVAAELLVVVHRRHRCTSRLHGDRVTGGVVGQVGVVGARDAHAVGEHRARRSGHGDDHRDRCRLTGTERAAGAVDLLPALGAGEPATGR